MGAKLILIFVFVLLSLNSVHAEYEKDIEKSSLFENTYNKPVIDYGQVIYGTGVVLLILLAILFLLKKLQLNKFNNSGLIQVISSFSITAKDKLLITKVGSEYLLLSVSNTGTRKIHTLNISDIDKSEVVTSNTTQGFANVLSSVLGKRHA